MKLGESLHSSSQCQQPYHTGNTGSRSITAVKQCRARLVLAWVTCWEYRVLLIFFLIPQLYCIHRGQTWSIEQALGQLASLSWTAHRNVDLPRTLLAGYLYENDLERFLARLERGSHLRFLAAICTTKRGACEQPALRISFFYDFCEERYG